MRCCSACAVSMEPVWVDFRAALVHVSSQVSVLPADRMLDVSLRKHLHAPFTCCALDMLACLCWTGPELGRSKQTPRAGDENEG